MPRALVRALLIVWLALLIGSVGLLVAMARGAAPEWQRTLLESVLEARLERAVRIGAVSGALTGRWTIHDLRIAADRDGLERDETIRLREISIELAMRRSLDRGALIVRTLHIHGAVLDFLRTTEGRWQLIGSSLAGGEPRPPRRREAPPRPPFPIAVLNLELSETELSISSEGSDAPLELIGRATLSDVWWRRSSPGAWPREGDLELSLATARPFGLPVQEAEVAARASGPELTIESLSAEGPLGRLSGDGQLVLGGWLFGPQIEQTGGRFAFEQIDLSTLAVDPPLPGSALDGTLSLRVQDAQAQPDSSDPGSLLTASLKLGASTFMNGRIDGARLDGRYETGSGRWRVDELALEVGEGTVRGEGEGRSAAVTRIAVASTPLDLEALPEAWLPVRRLSGSATLRATLAGPLLDPRGEVELLGEQLSVGRIGPMRAELALFALGGRRYRLESLEVRGSRTSSGDSPLFLESRTPATLFIDQASDAPLVEVEGLALRWAGGRLDVDGRLRKGRLEQMRVSMQSVDLALFNQLLDRPEDLGGLLAGTLELSGDALAPEATAALRWTRPRFGALSADAAHIRFESRRSAAALDAPFELALESEIMRGGGQPLALDLTLPIAPGSSEPLALISDPRARLALRAEALELDWLSPLAWPWLRASGLDVRAPAFAGTLSGRLDLRGGPDLPRAEGALTLRGAVAAAQLRGRDIAIGPITGVLDLSEGVLETAGLRIGEAGEGATPVEANGRLSWSPDGDRWTFALLGEGLGVDGMGRLEAEGSVDRGDLAPSWIRIDGIDAADLARIAGSALDARGPVSARMDLLGPLTRPRASLRGRWNEPGIGQIEADHLVFDALLETRGLSAHVELGRAGRRPLVADAFAALDARVPVSKIVAEPDLWLEDEESQLLLALDDFDLDWLALLAPNLPLRTTGRVDGQITLAGAEGRPRVRGEVMLEEGRLSLATQRSGIGPLEGKVRLEGDRAVLDQLLVGSKRGLAKLSGQWDWSADPAAGLDLTLALDQYRFDQLGLFRALLSGELTARGPIEALEIGGAVALSDVRVRFPSRSDPAFKEIRVLGLPERGSLREIREGEQEIVGIDQSSRVDVRLVLPPGTWVRGIGLQAEIVGEVAVKKPPGGELEYRGVLEVQEGRYTLQGRRFELERGTAMFSGAPGPIPDLDIVAVRDATLDVRVTAHVQGPADAPQLELTSDPPMDVAEIISYLFFGRGGESTGSDEGNGLQNTAASVAGGMLLREVAPELQDALRIDQITLTSGQNDEPPVVEIESQITPDVYLRLIQSFGASADEAVEVRWRFYRGFNLKSSVARSGVSSIDLLWEFDFWGLERYGLAGFLPGPMRSAARRADESGPSECRAPMRCDDDETGDRME